VRFLLAIVSAVMMTVSPGYALTIPAGGGPEITAGVVVTGYKVANDGTPYYLINDNVSLSVSVANAGTGNVLSSYGWTLSPFRRLLVITSRDGVVTRAPEMRSPTDTHVPPPLSFHFPDGLLPKQVEGVEWILGTGSVDPFSNTYPVSNVYEDPYFLSRQEGTYTVKAVIPMRTYPAEGQLYEDPESHLLYAELNNANWEGVVESPATVFHVTADRDGDGYFWPVDPVYGLNPLLAKIDCNDRDRTVHPDAVEIPGNGIDDDCNPATVDGGKPLGSVSIQAEVHNVGVGSKPVSTKSPLGGLMVLVLDRKQGSCVAKFGISWQNYKAVFDNCYSQAAAKVVTSTAGKAEAKVPPGNYMLVGMFDPPSGSPYPSGDEIYIGDTQVTVLDNKTSSGLMKLLTKADGKNVPAKYTIITGSQLIVVEPEYIEWTGNQELYPFVFESQGDWGVTTTISPPEGFVADKPSLSTVVNSDLKALQFTVTDVGSEWVETHVEHSVTHKKKAEKIKSKIGIRKKK
jgi:hypothetical protein